MANRITNRGALSFCLALVPLSGTALAQDGGVSSSPLIEEIVVTARNRAESIQDVPLAISAFSRDALEKRSISELDDIARFTPGFSFEDFSGGFAAPVIRGQAQTRVTALETNVSAFLDGIYIPRSWAMDVGTTNLERIEVVKGPQSARYGRNAFSGAINYVPIKAVLGDESPNIELSVTGGSDERADGNVIVQLPINERFAIAGSYNYSEFDGSWDNDHPFANLDVGRGTEGNIGGWEKESYTLSAIANPVDALELELGFYHFEQESEARAGATFSSGIPGTTNCGTVRFGTPSLICGELPSATEDAITDPRDFGAQTDTDIIRARIAWDISEAFELIYLYGLIEGDVEIGVSGEPDRINCGTLVGPPFFPALFNFQSTPNGDIEYDSHELRLAFDNGGSWRGSVGLFFSDGEDNNTFTSSSIAPITDPNSFQRFDTSAPSDFVNGPLNFLLTDERTETEVAAVFGEVHWTSGDQRTRAGLELRYSDTEITATNNRNGLVLDETFKVFTPRFGVERDLSDSSLLYLSIAQGAKAGGFNPTAIAESNRSFDEELNWTYEIGLKNTLLDGSLIANFAIFYTDWSDLQINSADPDAPDPNAVNITLNLGDAEVYGFEFDGLWQASENFAIDATFSHFEAEYSSGTVDGRLFRTNPLGQPPCDDIVCASNGDIGGNEIERTPQTQASLGAQWEGQLGAAGSYYLRADLSWQSEFFGDSANASEVPDRTLLNARAGFQFNDNVDLSLWVRNLTDERYVSNAFVVLLPFGNTWNTFFGERRTFGATIRWRSN
ncbi:MAG: TonB-dependent receptor [Pseudomonadota bacterium]